MFCYVRYVDLLTLTYDLDLCWFFSDNLPPLGLLRVFLQKMTHLSVETSFSKTTTENVNTVYSNIHVEIQPRHVSLSCSSSHFGTTETLAQKSQD